MNPRPPTPDDLAGSVLAVPPLARRPDLSIDAAANRALIRHIEAGGVRILLYGGNANLAASYTQLFVNSMNGQVTAVTGVNPNLKNLPMNPGAPASAS